jgi:hypothetical protein
MDSVRLRLSHIGQLNYTHDRNGLSFYSVEAIGTPEDTIYSVEGDRKAVIRSFGLFLKCPEVPGGAVEQHAWCGTPEIIEKHDDGDRDSHSALLQVAVGELFLRTLTEGGAKGDPMLRVGIKGVSMGLATTEYKQVWKTGETRGLGEIISVFAYFDTSSVLHQDIEQARVDPMPELMAKNTQAIVYLFKMLGWILAVAGVIAVGVWRR